MHADKMITVRVQYKVESVLKQIYNNYHLTYIIKQECLNNLV